MESSSSPEYVAAQQLPVLFKQYNRSLLFFAKSMVRSQEVAEEIVADSFIKLWQRKDSFADEDKVKAFLYIATKNACINHAQLVRSRQVHDGEAVDSLTSADPDVLARIIRAEFLQQVYDEIDRLPEKQREVFRLSYLEDLTTDEICERLQMSATAVFANRSRAAETLRKIFKDKELWLCLFLVDAMMGKL